MFDDLDSTGVIVVSLIGLVITLWIAFEIIRSAVLSALKKENEKQEGYQLKQTRLLSELLKHNGVDEQRIIDILDPSKPYTFEKREEVKS